MEVNLGKCFTLINNQTKLYGYRLVKNAAGRYSMIGGGLFLTYQLIQDFLNHHNTYPDKPKYLNHLFALVIITTGLGLFYGGTPKYGVVGALISILYIGPWSWYVSRGGLYY